MFRSIEANPKAKVVPPRVRCASLPMTAALALALASAPLAGCSDDTGTPALDAGPAQPDASPVDAMPGGDPDAMPGGDPDAAPDASVGDGVAPSASIVFPPSGSMTDADAITVRGTAEHDVGIAAIRINGVAATSSNQFAEWQVEVALDAGENTLLVETVDEQGDIDTGAAEVVVEYVAHRLDLPAGMIMAGPEQLLLIDRRFPGVLSTDLATGRIIELSGPERGSGPDFAFLAGIGFDAANNRAIALDDNRDEILGVAMDTGERSVISPAEASYGPLFDRPHSLAVDPEGAIAVVLDHSLAAVIAVDLSTGQRRELSGPGVGDGPAFLDHQLVTMDMPRNRALVVDQRDAPDGDSEESFDIIAVDLDTGDRSSVLGGYRLRGAHFAFATDPDNARGYVAMIDEGFAEVYEIDLLTGDFTLISTPSLGDGVEFRTPKGVAFDALNNRVLVLDDSADVVVSVDPSTGDRAAAIGYLRGSGHALVPLRKTAFEQSAERAYSLVIPKEAPALLVETDLRSGARTLRAGPELGNGLGYTRPTAMALDRDGGRVIFSHQSSQTLRTIDLATGNHSYLDGGEGPAFSSPSAMALDAENGRLLVADSSRDQLIALDLASEDRTLLLDESGGYPDSGGNGLAVDPAEQLAYLSSYQGLLRFDLETQDIEVIASDTVGSGVGLYFYQPTIALDPPGQLAFTIASADDDSRTALVSVDLATLARQELASSTVGRGPAIENGEMELLRDSKLMWLATSSSGLVLVDLATGDRVTVAR
ncbi:NHL repeat containing protein [Haliangium ochraceum]|uniref:NHL repeat containing protein n=1 Tax=Haliangium ochraceum (strain DSM 14365 / JCM 11303 / SMP-2) TaxID=502025 RepID=D0LVS0_HALO1|nr:NHL repeat containing protein [Haliangium ochraceum]ACY14054.1 NHL repeat containing protein [Haliangium ochraceum DSM 14365]